MQSKVTEKHGFGEKETVQEVTQACEGTGIIQGALSGVNEQAVGAAKEVSEGADEVAATEITGEIASEEGGEVEAFDKDAARQEINAEDTVKKVTANTIESLVMEYIPKVDILGFPIANVDMEETVAAVAMAIESGKPGEAGVVARPESGTGAGAGPAIGRHSMRIVTANAEILYHAYADSKLGELLHSADLIVPDGIGVVKAASRLGRPVKDRVAGVDLLWQLAAWAADKGRSIYLLGAARESVAGAAVALQVKYPALKIAGMHDGYFDKAEKERILQEIEEKRPDFLFIAMGFPAQDRFFVENRGRLPVGIMMGVGGAFDALSGRVQRAPGWIQKMNLEWAYRFAQNPKRLGRIWALPRFMMAVRRQKGREKG